LVRIKCAAGKPAGDSRVDAPQAGLMHRRHSQGATSSIDVDVNVN
jgi:hypothetical protein